jgi:cellulose biosynthesis protein BcsQ
VTTAKYLECKRGVATNFAAALARHSAVSARVCLVDTDPTTLDVTTRLAVAGPVIEDFARHKPPHIGQLARVHSPAMTVVGCGESAVGRVHFAAQRAIPQLRDAFDVIVCDLPGGPSGPGLAVGGRLELLDWLIVAVTPEPAALAATAHFLEHFNTARARGVVGNVRLAIVATGDESCAQVEDHEIEAALDEPLAARIPQLWGRAVPNPGFGPALAIPDLDESAYDLYSALQYQREHERDARQTLLTR